MAGILGNVSQSTDKAKGINLDLGLLQLNITLTLEGVQSLSDALRQALDQSQGAMQQSVNKVVDTVRQLGVEDLRRWAEQGGSEEKSAFNQLVSRLQDAAQSGQEEAGKLLQNLGGKISEAGEKVQGAASGETEQRH